MTLLEQSIAAELKHRQDLETQILTIVRARCETGSGRVQRGALHLYIYRQLGFHGQPGDTFAKFINKVMVNNGYRASFLSGKRCYCGLYFKGETKETWNHPVSDDIPFWSSNTEKFMFKEEVI